MVSPALAASSMDQLDHPQPCGTGLPEGFMWLLLFLDAVRCLYRLVWYHYLACDLRVPGIPDIHGCLAHWPVPAYLDHHDCRGLWSSGRYLHHQETVAAC